MVLSKLGNLANIPDSECDEVWKTVQTENIDIWPFEVGMKLSFLISPEKIHILRVFANINTF